MAIQRINEGITGQQAANIIYDNDFYAASTLRGASFRNSLNLWDINTATSGYYDPADGVTPVVNANYLTSINIPVTANTTYRAADMAGVGRGNVYFYNSAGSFISANVPTGGPNSTIVTPAGTAFMKVTVNKNLVNEGEFMVISGMELPTTYEPYGVTVVTKLNKNIIPNDVDIQNATIGENPFFDSEERPSRNLFNAATTVAGHFGADGLTPTASSNHRTSDFIAVAPSTLYVKGSVAIGPNGTGYNYWYDASQTLISVSQGGVATSPANAAFVRVVVRLDATPVSAFMFSLSPLPTEYEPYGVTVYSKTIKELYIPNAVLGKPYGKYVAIGDSITWGYTPRNNPNSGSQLNSYAKLTADAIAAEFVNAGISGSYISSPGNSPMVSRIDTLPNDADLITVMGGTNDFRNGVALGTIEDTGVNTYYGALKSVCQQLITKYQTARAETGQAPATIVLFTPFKMLTGSGWTYNPAIQNWVKAVIEVGAYFGIPVFDTNNECMVNPHLDRILDGTNPTSPDWYNPLIPDGIHPSQRCHERIAQFTTGFLRTLRK